LHNLNAKTLPNHENDYNAFMINGA
jgi:hypothetical protein